MFVGCTKNSMESIQFQGVNIDTIFALEGVQIITIPIYLAQIAKESSRCKWHLREVVQLRLNDIILDERKGSVVVREGKGTKRREIPLNTRARKSILDYLRVRPEVGSEYLYWGSETRPFKARRYKGGGSFY
jgi:integrase